MKHSGKAFRAALRIIFWTFVLLMALFAAGVLATLMGSVIAFMTSGFVALWTVFALFTFYFFRDPTPLAPVIPNAIVSPAHGKVDVVDEATETEWMGGPCKRISIFLSIFDVHVQKAPVSGTLEYHKHTEGSFLSATKAECADHNENVLLGFAPTDYPGQRIGVRLIAGLLARRIILWTEPGETVSRSDRISLIQYGSRCEVYLPLGVKVHVKLGDRVKGGESIVASFD
jgi:phosphatidylserine decarboxylase